MPAAGALGPGVTSRLDPGSQAVILRKWFAPLFFAGVCVLLWAVSFSGLPVGGPLMAAVTLLVCSLVAVGWRWLRGRFDVWFWHIRWRLAVSYLVIALIPLVLVSVTIFVFAYLATGQLLVRLAHERLTRIETEIDQVAAQITASPAVRDIAAEPDVTRAKALASGFDGGPELRALKRRYQAEAGGDDKLVAARIVAWSRQQGDVSGNFDFPRLPFETRSGRPGAAVRDIPAELVLSPGGDALEIRGASVLTGKARDIYVEVAISRKDLIESLEWPLGMDVRVLMLDDSEPLTAPKSLGGLPVLGVATLKPKTWRVGLPPEEPVTGVRSARANPNRVLVVQQSASELSRSIAGLGDESRLLGVTILLVAMGLFLLFEMLTLLAGMRIASSITGSVQSLFDGTRRVEQGDLAHRIPVVSRDQLGSLSVSFNRMTGSVENLLVQSGERERLEEELRIGRRIQQSLLPRSDYRDELFEIAGLSLPAKEVGGDYFDVFQLGDGRLAILVADVSGKGTEAAFYMAEVKGIMLALSRSHIRPVDVLREANTLLSSSLDRRTFVTMTYGVLDHETHEFAFARAGHNPVLHLEPGARSALSLRPAGLALGLDRTGRFGNILQESRFRLQPGALVMLYTDGVTDTMSDSGELYGEERLAHSLEGSRGKSAEGVRDAIAAELRRFAAVGPPHDDLTLVVIRAL